MLSNQHGRTISIFPTRQEAEQALDQILLAGFPITKAFLISEDWIDPKRWDFTWMRRLVDNARTGVIAGTPIELKKGVLIGNVTGCVGGLLLGLGTFKLANQNQDGLATILVFTPLIAAIGGVIGALVGLVLSNQQSKEVAVRISKGEFLLVVVGTDDEITHAEHILRTQNR